MGVIRKIEQRLDLLAALRSGKEVQLGYTRRGLASVIGLPFLPDGRTINGLRKLGAIHLEPAGRTDAGVDIFNVRLPLPPLPSENPDRGTV